MNDLFSSHAALISRPTRPVPAARLEQERQLPRRTSDAIVETTRRILVFCLVLVAALSAGTAMAAPVLSWVTPQPADFSTPRWVGAPFRSAIAVDFKLRVRNDSATDAARNVTALVTVAKNSATVIDGNAAFGDVGPGATVISRDTVTIQVASLTQVYEVASSISVRFASSTAPNRAPVANAGTAQTALARETVTLDGTKSSDPDGDPLTYAWSLLSQPGGSTAALSGATSARPTLVPDVAGIYQAQLVVSDGRLSSAPATVAVTVSAALLAGAPGALAVGSIGDVNVGGVPASDIDDSTNLFLSRINVMIDPQATVAQVNAAAALVNGTIAFSNRGSPLLTLAVPRQADATGIQALAAALQAQPGIVIATPDARAVIEVLPTDGGGAAVDPDALDHLLGSRFPAAWNAQSLLTGCGTRPVTVIVNDNFKFNAPDDVGTQLPGFVQGIFSGSLFEDGEHGYDVAMTLGASHDAIVPTGSHPRGECLRIEALNWGILGTFQATAELANRLSGVTENVVVNFSIGIGVPKTCGAAGSTTCTDADLRSASPGQIRDYVEGKVLVGLKWAEIGLSDVTLQRVLFVASAGNEAQKALALAYPGFAEARFNGTFSLAADLPTLQQSFTDPKMWGGGTTYPSAQLDAGRAAALAGYFASLNKMALSTGENVMTVGATTKSPTTFGMGLTPFSNRNARVAAVGEAIRRTSQRYMSGTSFSAPTVAGLAAYLWQLSDELRSQPVSRTAALIEANSAVLFDGAPLVDAYATVLALDRPGSMRVRAAILDVSGDGRFDDADVAQYLDAFVTRDGAKDYSRFDLNGDGQTGGSNFTRLDLDGANYLGEKAVLENVTLNIEGGEVTFNERTMKDLEALCYFAYSPLFDATEASTSRRRELLIDVCTPRLGVAGGVYSTDVPVPTRGTSLLVKVRAANGSFVTADVPVEITGPSGSGWNGGAAATVTFPAQTGRQFYIVDTQPVSGTYTARATIDGVPQVFRFQINATRSLAPVSGINIANSSNTTVYGLWSAAPGATSYLARVLDRSTGAIVKPVRFTLGTEATLTGLTLQLTGNYAFQVWAFTADLTSVSPPLPVQFDLSFNREFLPALKMSVSGGGTVNPGQTLQFSATLVGVSPNSVTWSANGGSITSSGLWTAPQIAGTYVITARSVAVPSLTASATATVLGTCTLDAAQRVWDGQWVVSGAAYSGIYGTNCTANPAFAEFLRTGVVTISPEKVIFGPGIREVLPSQSGPFNYSCRAFSAGTNQFGSSMNVARDDYLSDVEGEPIMVGDVVLKSSDVPSEYPCSARVYMRRP